MPVVSEAMPSRDRPSPEEGIATGAASSEPEKSTHRGPNHVRLVAIAGLRKLRGKANAREKVITTTRRGAVWPPSNGQSREVAQHK
jgi:hypothetical protein